MLNIIRQKIINAKFATCQDLTGKAVLVTGASINSLGFETAKILLSWGAEVTVTSRSNSHLIVDALRKTLPKECHQRIFHHELDLSSATSTQQFAQWYIDTRKSLDILINNAGIHLDLMSQWNSPKLSEDDFEIQWRTNYLGSTHLTHLLLGLLQGSGAKGRDARVVNVVSMLHDKGSNSEFFQPSKPYNSWNAYGQSKLGLIHFTTEFNRQFSAKGIHAYCLHPGSVFTNVASKGLTGHPFIERIRHFLSPIEAFFLKTPEEGAQTSIYCATEPNLQGGFYYRDCAIAKPSRDTEDGNIAKKLWDETEQWLATL